jgi:hypothetical protein
MTMQEEAVDIAIATKCACGHAAMVHHNVHDDRGALLERYAGPCMANVLRDLRAGYRHSYPCPCRCFTEVSP